jgi:UDP-glucose 4-epimerase
MSKVLVTGGAGFIGSHLIDRLLMEGNEVVALDNLDTGNREFIKHHFSNPEFEFFQVDLLSENIEGYFKGMAEVWHLAASVDTRSALDNTRIDIDQNILVTYKILEAMRKNSVKRVIFTSSSTVYGEAQVLPTPESYPCRPISLYGASKLACEGLISAYFHTFDLKAMIFRFANIVGPRATHGVISDFVQRLKDDPNELKILGDGNQKKSYLHVEDCINGMLLANRKAVDFEVFNLGSEDWITVKEIAEIVFTELHLTPKLEFGNADRGWRGDVPLMLLDISKIKKLGWKPKHNSKGAVVSTVKSLVSKK